MTKIAFPLIGLIAILALSSANANPVPDELAGTYTQNVPCKGDGTDRAELQVTISSERIDSKISVCTFQKVKQDGSQIDAQLECRFPSGPLIGNVTFNIKPNNTVAFVDRDKNYQSTLYRCSKRTGSSE
jgi:ABC-type multidrug transport system fused ATPase/permease subunit